MKIYSIGRLSKEDNGSDTPPPEDATPNPDGDNGNPEGGANTDGDGSGTGSSEPTPPEFPEMTDATEAAELPTDLEDPSSAPEDDGKSIAQIVEEAIEGASKAQDAHDDVGDATEDLSKLEATADVLESTEDNPDGDNPTADAATIANEHFRDRWLGKSASVRLATESLRESTLGKRAIAQESIRDTLRRVGEDIVKFLTGLYQWFMDLLTKFFKSSAKLRKHSKELKEQVDSLQMPEPSTKTFDSVRLYNHLSADGKFDPDYFKGAQFGAFVDIQQNIHNNLAPWALNFGDKIIQTISTALGLTPSRQMVYAHDFLVPPNFWGKEDMIVIKNPVDEGFGGLTAEELKNDNLVAYRSRVLPGNWTLFTTSVDVVAGSQTYNSTVLQNARRIKTSLVRYRGATDTESKTLPVMDKRQLLNALSEINRALDVFDKTRSYESKLNEIKKRAIGIARKLKAAQLTGARFDNGEELKRVFGLGTVGDFYSFVSQIPRVIDHPRAEFIGYTLRYLSAGLDYVSSSISNYGDGTVTTQKPSAMLLLES